MDETISAWLTALAAKQPTPGGGAAAALAAGAGASLIGMVAHYTTGPKWETAVSERMQAIAHEADRLREQAVELMEADALAFAEVGKAYKLPKETSDQAAERSTAIQKALIGAAEPPCQTVNVATLVVVLAEELTPAGNSAVISDVAVAASMAAAALEAAVVNIEINKKLIKDDSVKARLQSTVQEAHLTIEKAQAIVAKVRERIAS